MKRCNRCKEEKDLEAFSIHRARPDGRQVTCKECYKTLNNQSYMNSSSSRKQKVAERRNRVKAENKEIIKKVKDDNPCCFCGETEHCCLDFHHKDPTQKEFEISNSMKKNKGKLVEEIDKCVVICSNCHRKHHAGLKGYEL